jgi:hypothetical protein
MPARTSLFAELPEEILLQIFEYFSHPCTAEQEKSSEQWRYPRLSVRVDVDLGTLQRSRLVCQRSNAVICPIFCPVVRVALDSDSLQRLEQLLRNPIIARGIRGVDINLRYRPKVLATYINRYWTRVRHVIRKAERTCDWHTEFAEDYAEGDESEDAVQDRAYRKAMRRLHNISRNWTYQATRTQP